MYDFCESKTYEFNRVGIAICVISILFQVPQQQLTRPFAGNSFGGLAGTLAGQDPEACHQW